MNKKCFKEKTFVVLPEVSDLTKVTIFYFPVLVILTSVSCWTCTIYIKTLTRWTGGAKRCVISVLLACCIWQTWTSVESRAPAASRTAPTTPEVMSATAQQGTDWTQTDVAVTVCLTPRHNVSLAHTFMTEYSAVFHLGVFQKTWAHRHRWVCLGPGHVVRAVWLKCRMDCQSVSVCFVFVFV